MVRAGLIRQMGAGHVDVAAGRLARAPAGRGDHPRGDGRDRRPGDADAGAAAGRAVAQDRARYDIEELFKLTDRKGSELVLAMTHEEAVTFHIAQIVRSYRDLPLIVYHFQVKERDEPRPRAGRAAHARVHHEGRLQLRPRPGGPGARYELHVGAYDRMMERTGPALLPRRGRRRDDGRRTARTSTWRPARPARTRSCWATATPPTSRSPARRPGSRRSASDTVRTASR